MTTEFNFELSGDQVVHFTDPIVGYDIIPEKGTSENRTALFFQDQIQEANNYNIEVANEKVGNIAFNYPRVESELLYFSSSELEDQLKNSGIKNFQVLNRDVKDLGKNIESVSEGDQYWKWFLILALVFLAIEIILIRIKL